VSKERGRAANVKCFETKRLRTPFQKEEQDLSSQAQTSRSIHTPQHLFGRFGRDKNDANVPQQDEDSSRRRSLSPGGMQLIQRYREQYGSNRDQDQARECVDDSRSPIGSRGSRTSRLSQSRFMNRSLSQKRIK